MYVKRSKCSFLVWRAFLLIHLVIVFLHHLVLVSSDSSLSFLRSIYASYSTSSFFFVFHLNYFFDSSYDFRLDPIFLNFSFFSTYLFFLQLYFPCFQRAVYWPTVKLNIRLIFRRTWSRWLIELWPTSTWTRQSVVCLSTLILKLCVYVYYLFSLPKLYILTIRVFSNMSNKLISINFHQQAYISTSSLGLQSRLTFSKYWLLIFVYFILKRVRYHLFHIRLFRDEMCTIVIMTCF